MKNEKHKCMPIAEIEMRIVCAECNKNLMKEDYKIKFRKWISEIL